MSGVESNLDRILKALGHPIRRRILRSLVEKPGSASSLAREFGLELSAVSYHLNRILAEDCNAVDLIEMIPRRGSVEKVYRLNAKLWSDLQAVAEAERAKGGGLRRLTLGECFLGAVEAMDGDAFIELEGSAWEWFAVTVDTKAWKAIAKARREFNKCVEKAVEESRKRSQGRSKTHDVVVGVAAFPAAPRKRPS
ncbi:MAG: ArsR/SmtB family transcription factor [Solirubrobacterales bacterium]